MAKQIRVLLVDDSAMARAMLRSIFDSDPTFTVSGEASNGAEAVALVNNERPDLIAMDLEMPQMGGVEAIEEIMSFRPVPILVVSDYSNAQQAYRAVAHGAIDVVAKPGLTDQEIHTFLDRARLVAAIPVIRHIKSSPTPMPPAIIEAPALPQSVAPMPPLTDEVSARGLVFGLASSTGGPLALTSILRQLPDRFSSPILIAQHVLPGFASGMAKWLASETHLPVKLASQGEKIMPGQVYLSPSEAHLSIAPGGLVNLLPLRERDTYRPSCDVLLQSLASVYGQRSVGIILTGMGSDGAKGLASIQAAGGRTLAQDEASSVVYGMNRFAIEHGTVDRVLPLDDIAAAMVQLVSKVRQP